MYFLWVMAFSVAVIRSPAASIFDFPARISVRIPVVYSDAIFCTSPANWISDVFWPIFLRW